MSGLDIGIQAESYLSTLRRKGRKESTIICYRNGLRQCFACLMRDHRSTLAEDIAAESPYETTSFTTAVTESKYEAAAILPFDETAAECAESADGSVLLSVADPAAFFRTQDAAEYSDVSVKIEFAFDRPVSCRVEFALPSGNSAVIVYTYSY